MKILVVRKVYYLVVMLYTYVCADDIGEAYNLIKDLEPTTPQEYILKGVVNAALGQEQGSVSTGFFLLVTFVALLQAIQGYGLQY